MFGYVIPDKNNMYIKDFNVFQSYYCGLCKTLARTGGPLTRLCTNYDVTFYNALLHSVADIPVAFERRVCLVNMRKKPVVVPDDLTRKTADIAVLLVYYNADDDVRDGRKSRWFVKARLRLRKRAAARRLPEIDAQRPVDIPPYHGAGTRDRAPVPVAAKLDVAVPVGLHLD